MTQPAAPLDLARRAIRPPKTAFWFSAGDEIKMTEPSGTESIYEASGISVMFSGAIVETELGLESESSSLRSGRHTRERDRRGGRT